MELVIVSGNRRRTESGYVSPSKEKRVAINFCGEGFGDKGKKLISLDLKREIHPCYKNQVTECFQGGFYELKEKNAIDGGGCEDCS